MHAREKDACGQLAEIWHEYYSSLLVLPTLEHMENFVPHNLSDDAP